MNKCVVLSTAHILLLWCTWIYLYWWEWVSTHTVVLLNIQEFLNHTHQKRSVRLLILKTKKNTFLLMALLTLQVEYEWDIPINILQWVKIRFWSKCSDWVQVIFGRSSEVKMTPLHGTTHLQLNCVRKISENNIVLFSKLVWCWKDTEQLDVVPAVSLPTQIYYKR